MEDIYCESQSVHATDDHGEAFFSQILTYNSARKGEQVLLASENGSRPFLLGGGLNWNLPFPNSLNHKVMYQLDSLPGTSLADPRLLSIYAKERNDRWLINLVFVGKYRGEEIERRFGHGNSFEANGFTIHRFSLDALVKMGDDDFHYPETKPAVSLLRSRLRHKSLVGYKDAIHTVSSEYSAEGQFSTAMGIVSVVCYDPRSRQFALVRQGRPGEENLISLPGGKIDKGVCPNTAVRLEVGPETGGVSMVYTSILGCLVNSKVKLRTGEIKPVLNIVYSATAINGFEGHQRPPDDEIRGIEFKTLKEIQALSKDMCRTPDVKPATLLFAADKPRLPLDLVRLI